MLLIRAAALACVCVYVCVSKSCSGPHVVACVKGKCTAVYEYLPA